jgi:hypothetical protein
MEGQLTVRRGDLYSVRMEVSSVHEMSVGRDSTVGIRQKGVVIHSEEV